MYGINAGSYLGKSSRFEGMEGGEQEAMPHIPSKGCSVLLGVRQKGSLSRKHKRWFLGSISLCQCLEGKYSEHEGGGEKHNNHRKKCPWPYYLRLWSCEAPCTTSGQEISSRTGELQQQPRSWWACWSTQQLSLSASVLNHCHDVSPCLWDADFMLCGGYCICLHFGWHVLIRILQWLRMWDTEEKEGKSQRTCALSLNNFIRCCDCQDV